jgi:hypothetical protein
MDLAFAAAFAFDDVLGPDGKPLGKTACLHEILQRKSRKLVTNSSSAIRFQGAVSRPQKSGVLGNGL